MNPRRLLLAGSGLAVMVLVVIGLIELSGNSTTSASTLTPSQMQARLAGSPPQLASLHEQAGELLGGGLESLRVRLAELRGRPVVINKWASWCGPCRAEFGVFQRVSVNRGRQVAFIGVDSGESGRGAPEAFLRRFPVSYPSYYDSSGAAGEAITEGSNVTPVTVFIDSRGRKFVRQGPYPSVAKLEADIERYALEG